MGETLATRPRGAAHLSPDSSARIVWPHSLIAIELSYTVNGSDCDPLCPVKKELRCMSAVPPEMKRLC
jgi:hypothetical protein